MGGAACGLCVWGLRWAKTLTNLITDPENIVLPQRTKHLATTPNVGQGNGGYFDISFVSKSY